MAILLANREVTTKVDGNQDKVATSFIKDKKGRKGLLIRVWKSKYIWETADLEKVKGQRSDDSLLDPLGSKCSILRSLILFTIETVVGKDLQFNRAILRCYSLLILHFNHGDKVRDITRLIATK